MFQAFRLVLLCGCLFGAIHVTSQLYSSEDIDALFDPFVQNSAEQVDLYKTKIFKLIEAQNQYLEIIQQQNPSHVEYENSKFVIKSPPLDNEAMPKFDNQDLFSWPAHSHNRNEPQLLFTLDLHKRLSIWQFFSSSSVNFLYRMDLLTQDELSLYDCVKLKSFLFAQHGSNRATSAQVAVLFRKKQDGHSGTDRLVLYTVNGYMDGKLFVVVNSYEEQTIRSEVISDFDALVSSPTRVYLSMIQSTNSSNHKFQLQLYFRSGHKFDLLASQDSNYVRNAFQVKLATLDGLLYLICSHRSNLNWEGSYNDQLNSITIFQMISQFPHSRTKLNFVSSVSNSSLVGAISELGLFHLSGNNDFIFIPKRDSVDVYWWDGQSLVYYDTLAQSRPIAFSLLKLSSVYSVPPLILSSDGSTLELYEKLYDKFNKRSINIPIRNGYSIDRFEIFPVQSGSLYKIWVKFAEMSGQSFGHSTNRPHFYSHFLDVELYKTDSNEDIPNLDSCLIDLRDRIQEGGNFTRSLSNQSEKLLVISPNKPVIEVDVIVNDTFRTGKSAPNLYLTVPVSDEHILHANHVMSNFETAEARLKQLNHQLLNGVVFKSANQTVQTPVYFTSQDESFRTEQLQIKQVNSQNLYLNDVRFDYYANSCLTYHSDQLIEVDSLTFDGGLEVEHISLNAVNSGIDMNQALLVIPGHSSEGGTMFVSHKASHQYAWLELQNGTTAPVINDVQLKNVFQDSAHAVPLLRGHKHFARLFADQIIVDTHFNQRDFRRLLSDIVWLKNDQLSHQIITGPWTHTNRILVDHLSITNNVNGRFDVQEFVNHTARTNADHLSIQGPVNFVDVVNMASDLFVDRTIDGLHFGSDVVLLKGDQNFVDGSIRPGGSLQFRMSVRFEQNLRFEVLNGRFSSDHFVLRSSPKSEAVYLPGKHFVSDLRVLGNVDLVPYATVNNVDLSALFDQLNTMSSFNTPLQIRELVINGPLYTAQLNQITALELSSLYSQMWLRGTSQTIPFPFDYQKSVIFVKRLRFGFYRNLQFPRDFFRKSNSSEPSVMRIGASKYFSSVSISMDNLSLTRQKGFINGYNIRDLYERGMVRLGGGGPSNHSQLDQISGQKTFNTLRIRGNLYLLNGGLVNDKLLNWVIRVDSAQPTLQVPNLLSFGDVYLEPGNFWVQDLMVQNNLLGHNFGQFVQEMVQHSSQLDNPNSRAVLILYNKNFASGLSVGSIESNGSIGLVNMRHLLTNVVTLDSDQTVHTLLRFDNATFGGEIGHFNSVNSLVTGYFRSVIRKDQSVVHISGQKYFHNRVLVVNDLRSLSPAINSHLNLTHLVFNSLMRQGNQVVHASHVFVRPVQFLDLHMSIDGTIVNNIPLALWTLLNSQSLLIRNDVIFENLYRVGRLKVVGRLNNCQLDVLIKNSTFRHHTDLTFNLTGLYVLPQVTVKGDLRFLSVVNDIDNFITQIVTADDQRPIESNLLFVDYVWSKELHVNHLINQRNLTYLLRDAVYVELPQRITGHKQFRKPLKIVGYVSMPPQRGQLRLHGLFDQVNMTHLFGTTVRTDRFSSIIQGNKFFTGWVTFVGNVSVGRLLNGLQIPNDLVLTFTDELIRGETIFTKRVDIRQNLNAALINQINLTQFVNRCVLIDGTQLDQQVTNTITFQKPIHVHNLTVLYKINDIPVDHLIHRHGDLRGNPVVVNGLKHFRQTMFVKGQLTILNQVNGINFDKDIAQEVIYLKSNGNQSMSGMVIFDRGVQVDNMNIREQINQINVREVNSEHISQMENFLEDTNQAIEAMFQNFNQSTRSMEHSFIHHQMTAIKYLKLVQTLEPSFAGRLWPIHSGGQSTALLSTIQHHLPSSPSCVNSSVSLNHYYHSLYAVHSQSGYLYQDHRFSTSKLVPEQIQLVYPLQSTKDNLVAVISSREFCAGNQGQVRFEHRVWFVSVAHLLVYLAEPVHPNAHLLQDSLNQSVHSARLFVHHTDPTVLYLLVLYQKAYHGIRPSGRLVLYRYRAQASPDQSLVPLAQPNILPVPVFDIDIVLHHFPNSSQPTLLLSTAGPFGSLFVWNQMTEQFESTLPTGNPPDHHQQWPYRLTKFVASPYTSSLYLLFAGSVTSTPSACCSVECSLVDNQIDVYQVGSDLAVWFYQRLQSQSDQPVIALESLSIGTRLQSQLSFAPSIYFFALTSRSLQLYQHVGFNQFESIAKYGSLDQSSSYLRGLTGMTFYWVNSGLDPDRLYLLLSSSIAGHSQLVQVLLSGQTSSESIFSREGLIRQHHFTNL